MDTQKADLNTISIANMHVHVNRAFVLVANKNQLNLDTPSLPNLNSYKLLMKQGEKLGKPDRIYAVWSTFIRFSKVHLFVYLFDKCTCR